MILISSCSWFREDTEQFYYDYSIKILKEAVAVETRDLCGFYEQEPTFKVASNFDRKIDGFYEPTKMEINYNAWKPGVISHETVHHMSRVNNWNRKCLEEMLAQSVKHSVEQHMELMYIYSKLQRAK
jgi:hypothetical protein